MSTTRVALPAFPLVGVVPVSPGGDSPSRPGCWRNNHDCTHQYAPCVPILPDNPPFAPQNRYLAVT